MRRWAKRILILLAIFVVPPAAFFFYAGWQAERELRAVIAELDATGEPWRLEDMVAAQPKPVEEDDLFPLILKVRSQIPYRLSSDKIISKALDRPPNVVIPTEEAEAFHELMQKIATPLKEARKIAAMPDGRLHARWADDNPWPNFDDITKAREFMHLLHLAAAWHAQQGDLDTAIEDCLAMQRCSLAVQDEFTIMAQLARMAFQAIALEDLQRVLAQGQAPPKQLQHLQTVWEQFDCQRAMVNGLRGERAGCHRLFEALASGKVKWQDFAATGKKSHSIVERLEEFWMLSNLKQAHAWLLRHHTKAINLLQLPEWERTEGSKTLEAKVRGAPGVARSATPALIKVFEAHCRSEAQRRCTFVALAAERFRLEQGRWPATLVDLCPKYVAKVPLDPYCGQPLQFRATADGVVIYSIGPDGKQCGNRQEEQAAGRWPIPYEFRLWNVPQRRLVVVGKP